MKHFVVTFSGNLSLFFCLILTCPFQRVRFLFLFSLWNINLGFLSLLYFTQREAAHFRAAFRQVYIKLFISEFLLSAKSFYIIPYFYFSFNNIRSYKVALHHNSKVIPDLPFVFNCLVQKVSPSVSFPPYRAKILFVQSLKV